jgi:ribosomal protein S7
MSLGIPQNLLQQSLAAVPAAFQAPTQGAILQQKQAEAQLGTAKAQQELAQLQSAEQTGLTPELIEQAQAVEKVFLSSLAGGRPELGKAILDAFLKENPAAASKMIALGEFEIPEAKGNITAKVFEDTVTGEVVSQVFEDGRPIERFPLEGLQSVGAKSEAELAKERKQKKATGELAAEIEQKKQKGIREEKSEELLDIVRKNVDLMDDLEPDIPALGRVGGAIEQAKAFFGTSPHVKALNDLSGVLVTQLAKKVAGETGRLTNEDIDRAKGLIYSPLDTPAERALKKRILRELLDEPDKKKAAKIFNEATEIFKVQEGDPSFDIKELDEIDGELFEIVRDEAGKKIGRRRVK